MREKYSIQKMNIAHAKQIATWKYKDEYKFYSSENTKESMDEMMDGTYYSVCNKDELVGFICFGRNATIEEGNEIQAYNNETYTDFGLGMKPDLCGKGLGLEFVTNSMRFAKKYLGIRKLRLTVASFNKRAIKVYQRAGFKEICSFIRKSDNVEFKVMVSELL